VKGAVRVRRRRSVLLVTLGVLLAAGLAVGGYLLLTRTELFTVRAVEVGGITGAKADTVRAAAAVPPGTPLIAVDTDELARRIATVPGIGQVDVTLRWPSTVYVQVSERVPIAVTSGLGERRLLDAAGNAYATAPDPPPALPVLEVVHAAADDPATVAALKVLAALPPPVRAELVAVAASAPDAVTVRLTKDRSVRWGSAERSDRKAAVLVPLLTQPGRVYDVASPDLPTVRR
jgi:cell division protein FtsQ